MRQARYCHGWVLLQDHDMTYSVSRSGPPLCREMLLPALITTVTRDMGGEPHRIRPSHGIALRCTAKYCTIDGYCVTDKGAKNKIPRLVFAHSSPSTPLHVSQGCRTQSPKPQTSLPQNPSDRLTPQPSHPIPSHPPCSPRASAPNLPPLRDASKLAPPANHTSLQPSLRLRQGCLSLACLVSSQVPPEWFRSANTSIPRRPIR